ncbi:bifunctional UDP-N-acetylglucosamine diphosphorylase/glucosamine-1-phosphate N-acetyltransferase GlmU [Anthocerotibacter panamensis]|uniref:bifunctional UDP-N-acetylglucosamine diphosphorylase/glucosamine-1-phosphate N-acetyltransferase GlmU n=1 Tax=Anthocerotibacter panamensis TaxID=2857077 RepID=UPI001FD8F043|nr:bifunctional UDP-N-acetylglucosamine diphosphorylase/glucosamine-1-phosphate N-acetyltransferase GlmU [Anthocerotibacter panamensis]
MTEVRVVILAAGKGTRMRSPRPKVLHRVMGRTLLGHVLAACQGIGPVTVIVGHGAEEVQAHFSQEPITWVLQREQKGTGHALQQLLTPLRDFQGRVLVVNGDAPLVTPYTLQRLVQAQTAALLAATVPDPTGYGRVFCSGPYVRAIVEEKECTPAERAHSFINGGAYCFDWPTLAPLLQGLGAANSQGEYYLTDVFQHLERVVALEASDWREVWGVNNRAELSRAGQALNQRILEHWLLAGVEVIDPVTTTIEVTVDLAPEVVIEPGSHLRGNTTVAAGAVIGPGSLIENSAIGAGSEILYSVVRNSVVGERVTVGPYAHLRAGTVIADCCRIGNFVEIKNTQIGARTNAAHLSYLGDSTVGARVNIAAGTITANYDGMHKHPTILKDDVKTGVNCTFVAPVTVGEGATIAAGSVINEDVPPHSLAIARARQVVKEGWKPRSPQEECAHED